MAIQDDIQLFVELLIEGENAAFEKATPFINSTDFQKAFEYQHKDIKQFFASYWKLHENTLKNLENPRLSRSNMLGLFNAIDNKKIWEEFNASFIQRWKLIFRQKQLTLDRNEVEIPAGFVHLKNIQTLTLKGKTVPESILNLRYLKSLKLDKSKIRVLPAFLSKLAFLEELNCSGLKIKEIPDFSERFKNLKILTLSENLLKTFPKFIIEAEKLEELYLDYNMLQEIPLEIGQLQQLKILCLDKNKLKQLPDSIGELTQLEELKLRWNNLSAVPKSLGNLKKIRMLDLKFNYEIKKEGFWYKLKYNIFGVRQLRKKELPIEVQKLEPQCSIIIA